MKIVASTGKEDIALVYVAEMGSGKLLEFVESLQPPHPREEKWVLLVSTLFGCPVECAMCDAGGFYRGRVSKEEIFAQIDYMVRKRFPDGHIPSRQFKIQFARMGEPTFNQDVLSVIEELPNRYLAPGFMPSVSTIAPQGCEEFLERLLRIKQKMFIGGAFQFQFSIHTTDTRMRDEIIPVKKWDFAEMSAYGERFFQTGDRKITLNFALAEDAPVDASVLLKYFDPAKFLIKITPLNPTYRAIENRLTTYIHPTSGDQNSRIVQDLEHAGYQVIVSIGEVEENYIGSNCGQYVMKHLQAHTPMQDGYTYAVK